MHATYKNALMWTLYGAFFLLLPLPFRFPLGFRFFVQAALFRFRSCGIFLLGLLYRSPLCCRLRVRLFRSGGSFSR